jgi:hypothetical protein
MSDMLTRIAENMVARTTGPLHFRILLQPIMAMIFASLDGLKDAKAGNAPYLWTLVTDREHRAKMARNGWSSVGKVFILALVLDVVYQFMVQHFVYLGEAVITAFLLAIVPYVALRGVVTRLARRRRRGETT